MSFWRLMQIVIFWNFIFILSYRNRGIWYFWIRTFFLNKSMGCFDFKLEIPVGSETSSFTEMCEIQITLLVSFSDMIRYMSWTASAFSFCSRRQIITGLQLMHLPFLFLFVSIVMAGRYFKINRNVDKNSCSNIRTLVKEPVLIFHIKNSNVHLNCNFIFSINYPLPT